MRGKLYYHSNSDACSRITPADAGKTQVEQQITEQKTDHPRGCGENDAFPIFARHFIGSPPRMRGKQNGK